MLDFVIAFTKTFAADARVKSTFLQQKEGNLYHFFYNFPFFGFAFNPIRLEGVGAFNWNFDP